MDLEVSSCTYSQLVFDKGAENINGENIVSSINGVGKTGHSHFKRRKLDPFLTPLTTMNLKCMKDLNIRPETVKLQEEHIKKMSFYPIVIISNSGMWLPPIPAPQHWKTHLASFHCFHIVGERLPASQPEGEIVIILFMYWGRISVEPLSSCKGWHLLKWSERSLKLGDSNPGFIFAWLHYSEPLFILQRKGYSYQCTFHICCENYK